MEDLIGGSIALGLAAGGALALVYAAFRVKTRDDTIATQKGYIEALTDRCNEAERREAKAEARNAVLTDTFAQEIARAIVVAIRQEFDRGR